MRALCADPTSSARAPEKIRLSPSAPPGDSGRYGSIQDDGRNFKIRDPELDDTEISIRWRQELDRPALLAAQIEPEAPREPALNWLAAQLYLAVQKRLDEMAALESGTRRFTTLFLQVLKARASLRAFCEEGTESWASRATKDLLDLASALDFFDLAKITPFLQWLSAVLPPGKAALLVDSLLPVEDARLTNRLSDSENVELARVVEAVGRAQRRSYFLGRYDLAGAFRLGSLLSRLRWKRSRQAGALGAAFAFADFLIPRLLAGCLIGILPFFLTDEAWRLATSLPWPLLAGILFSTLLAVGLYLFYDREVADPAHLARSWGVVLVAAIGLTEALAFAGLLQWLAAGHFNAVLMENQPELPDRLSCGWNLNVFLASTAFSLGVGVFTQLIWQDKAVTAPP